MRRWESGRYGYKYFLVLEKTYIGSVGWEKGEYVASLKAPISRQRNFPTSQEAEKWVEERSLLDAQLLAKVLSV